RRAFQARVRQQLVPGTYRAPVFVDYQFADEVTLPKEAAVDRLLHAPMKVEIPSDGRMHLSLEGANGWGYHSFNCTPEAMHGGLWAFLASTFVSSDPVNDGGWFAIDFQLPPGTWANPDHYMTSHSESWFILTPACNALALPLSRANFSRGYIEEMVAGWGDGNMMQGGALSDIGEGTAICNMEMCCTGAGAGFAQDGLDHASCAWFPAVDMGAVEDWEATEPLVYLGRTIKEDSAGMGRQRGGLGFESLRMVWTDRLLLQNVSDGAVFCNVGLYGGYPSGSGYRHLSKSNNLEELFASRSPYPTADWEQASLAGEEILDNRGVTLLTEFERHDLYLAIIKGGPGVGDPLERVPQAVEADLSSGHLSTRAATEVYGVVAEDAQATAAQREQLRETRRARAVPVREWMTVQRERILRREFAEPVVEMYRSSMQLSDEWAAEYREFWALDEQFEF
ncbi:MAG: N-methylhydantoinase, partial [Chloroflexota bacterium]|nr:N-methylhydantoinase [Chloroflexota bacterium]